MLDILLTIDIDADYFDQSLHSSDDQRPTWRGVNEAVPLLAELFESYKGSDGSDCVATWFVRADDQVGYYHGLNSYLFHQYHDYWVSLLGKSHEIGWHPHLYKNENGRWLQQTDPIQLRRQLNESLLLIRSEGWQIISSRIGEAYFSNAVGDYLIKLGIKCDCTCLPGRKRIDHSRNIDWLNSPGIPYYPSVNDYRIPGDPHLELLEIPFSMVDVLADYDKQPLRRYVDLSFWHRCLKQGLYELLGRTRFLTTIIHPSTILPSLSKEPHGLLSFSLEEVKKNLDYIIGILKNRSIEYRFTTVARFQNEFSHARFAES